MSFPSLVPRQAAGWAEMKSPHRFFRVQKVERLANQIRYDVSPSIDNDVDKVPTNTRLELSMNQPVVCTDAGAIDEDNVPFRLIDSGHQGVNDGRALSWAGTD